MLQFIFKGDEENINSIWEMSCLPRFQNVLIINSWPHCMKGGKDKRGGERDANVTRIIT